MFYILIAILIVLDQVTKFFVRANISVGESIAIIPNIFNLTYIQNRGAAFGLMQHKQFIFVIIGIIVVIGGCYYINKNIKSISISEKLSVTLIVSGAVGNMIDRVKDGFVTDFFDFRFIWNYVFNVADIFLVIGVILFAVLAIRKDIVKDK